MADQGSGKKKKVSKKNKKSWRKFIDTKDVDAFLDEKRLEERLGVPFAERPNDELFQIDNEDTREASAVKEKILARKREKFLRPYRCFQALLPSSAVPDPITKRNKGKPYEERKSDFVKKMEEMKILAGHGRNKLLTALKNRKLADEQRKARIRRGEFNKDLWAEIPENPETMSDDVKWLRKDAYLHVLNNTGNRIKRRPTTMSVKTSVLTPIEAPHPGLSYNPSLEEHNDLLSKVAEDEMKLIKEEKHLNRVVTNMIPKVTLEEVEVNWMKEMSQGLPQFQEEKGEERDSGVEECENDFVGNPIVTREKKKTLQKRRKIKEAKAEAIRRREFKLEKKKSSDIDRLNLLKKDMTKREQKLDLLKKKREKAKLAKVGQPKMLSRHKFEPLEVEFSMGNELSGNLRNVKPEGSILKDRFKRMQERNIVEPRTRQTKRLKYKRKIIEKPSYKMPWETKDF